MSFINKNVNLVLVFLLILTIGALISFTLYYQKNFMELNEKYVGKATELNRLTDDLLNKKGELKKIMSDFELKNMREQDLSEKYDTLRQDNYKLMKLLNDTNNSLTSTKKELLGTRTELNSRLMELQSTKNILLSTQKQLENANALISLKNQEIKRLDDLIDELEDEIHNLKNPS